MSKMTHAKIYLGNRLEVQRQTETGYCFEYVVQGGHHWDGVNWTNIF